MTETHGTDAREPERPRYRAVTANQVAAWNLARCRRNAGLTQEQLGLRIGWTTSAVSDAERSWSSGRTREFDAQALTEIAVALAVPITALLLPPDPEEGQILEVCNQEGALTLSEYLTLAVMPDSDLGEDATEAYRDRFNALARQYLSPEWASWVSRILAGGRSREQAADLAALLRERERDAQVAAAQWRALAEEIEAAGKDKP